MNRKEFIENFDYTILVEYFQSMVLMPPKITHTNVLQILNMIFEKYPELNNNLEFTTYQTTHQGYCYIDELDRNQYYKNITCLEFEAFYPTLYYNNFIDGTIDYNENLFLLYSLMCAFRNYCRKHYPELYSTFRIFFHSFFGYLAIRGNIRNHYPYNYFLKVCNILRPYFLYADTDSIYLKNITSETLVNILNENDINIPCLIRPLKYFFIEGKKRHASYYKNDNEYKFDIKGFRKEEEINKIRRNFLSDFRIEKIEKLLNNK